ncbi:HD domain-containing protein [SAR202 cluster bacterium AC-647-N09_OGT_505m]|nr:HD domain-containing protein [SAR202 cluster bacterium AC-647-N09_OGT_505m]
MPILSSDNPKLDALLFQLPTGLKEHLARARDKAMELAAIHGVDPLKAGLAALAHDIARGMKEVELLDRARFYGLDLHPVEERVPVLLHGSIGADMLQRECGIEDSEVLEAVRWHSTFNKGLSQVAKITFLADKLDYKKASRYPYLDRIDRLAKEDLDAAVLSFLQEELVSMIGSGQLVHPASVEGRNELLESQRLV